MKFNRHSDLEGKHAFLGASTPHWQNYDDEKLLIKIAQRDAAAIGTRKHNLACELIKLGVKLPNTAQTLNMYVNDCIGYRMTPEQTLFYSWNAFGTTDAIGFTMGPDEIPVLRIFDLKTGVSKATVRQLETYAGFFCLEYKIRPMEINYDLRIYQNDEIYSFETDPEQIAHVMSRIVECDKIVERANSEGV